MSSSPSSNELALTYRAEACSIGSVPVLAKFVVARRRHGSASAETRSRTYHCRSRPEGHNHVCPEVPLSERN
jgi:hypothetical protein